MTALVLLRNGYKLSIYSTRFTAKFKLIDNNTTTVKTLGVDISEAINNLQIDKFNVVFTAPHNVFKAYSNNIIKPKDIIHTREEFGSIVDKPNGNIYVGGLFVCNLKPFKYAYNLYPKHISLDRDRKVPKSFDVSYSVGKIQETFEEFDKTGKTADTEYVTIPNKILATYKPKIINNDITFATTIKNAEGKEINVLVSDSFKRQLLNKSFFSGIVTRLKSYLASAFGIPELALKFRNKYCYSPDAKLDFDELMSRFGVVVGDDNKNEDLPF